MVETARELNDANKRWAIKTYQNQRQAENNEFADAIRGLLENNDYSVQPDPESSDDIDKVRLWYESIKQEQLNKGKGEYAQNKWTNKSTVFFQNLIQTKSLIDKYRLWKEQKCTCMYTGRFISITDLFDENKIDFEHTIPRSISFDNSLANLTVCFADYNRNIKKNLIPAKLPNYEHEANGFTAIKPRLIDWENKVEHIKSMVEFWKGKSKSAPTKDYKDEAIRQRHLWQMDLDYWRNKLERFTMSEVKSGFKNSQLVDTQLISKYAMHYLRTAFNTVEVQKGAITADFRKIFGIQATYEKKSRAKHSHHAIDAAVLTLIPHAAKRDKILKCFYEIREGKKFKIEAQLQWLEEELKKEIWHLDLPKVNEIIDSIENQILINNITRDQVLTPGKKVVRHRGKIVYLKDKEGKLILNENNTPKSKLAQGDSIRGQLHKETFYGAIKEPIRNEVSEKPIIEDGKFLYERGDDGKDKITMVVRKLIHDFTTEKDFDSIIDPWVKYSIKKTIQERLDLKLTFKEAINQDIWLLDKNENPIKNDKNGKLLSPLRHVRCKVAAGRGFMTKEKSLVIKQQTYLSNQEHKKWYYAQNADNYLYLLYETESKKGIMRAFRIINYQEISQIGIKTRNELLSIPFYATYEKITKSEMYTYKLIAIIGIGTKVLFKTNEDEMISNLLPDELSRRLYKVYKFNEIGSTGYVYFHFHLEARPDKELNEGDNDFEIDKYQPRLRLPADKIYCLFENQDFEILPDGRIRFKHSC